MKYADGPEFLRDMQATSRVSGEVVRRLNIQLDGWGRWGTRLPAPLCTRPCPRTSKLWLG